MGLAKLQSADLEEAELEGARLYGAQLHSVNLKGTQLQRANLGEVQLQGANLQGAQLQGADFEGIPWPPAWRSQLQGANLAYAGLQGANLTYAELQGANLVGADLRGANLAEAELWGADLRSAKLYGAIIEHGGAALVDLRATRWTPHNAEPAETGEVLGHTIADKDWGKKALERIEHAGNAGLPSPILESCLIDPKVTPGLKCRRQWLPAEVEAFRTELFPVLEKLACQSFAIARGLILQIDPSETSGGRFGLAERFAALLDERECEGLGSLPEADKNRIRDLAKREDELRAQSSAGKPMEEAPASPTPPPAIAPEPP